MISDRHLPVDAHKLNVEHIRRVNNSPLIFIPGYLKAAAPFDDLSEASIYAKLREIKGNILNAVEISLVKEYGGPDALVIMHRIGEACSTRNTSWQIGEYEERGFQAVGHQVCTLGHTPFDWFIMTNNFDPTIPKFDRKLQILVVDEGEVETPHKVAYLGISGMRFTSMGTGPDAPVDESVYASTFAKIDYELLPEEVRAFMETEK